MLQFEIPSKLLVFNKFSKNGCKIGSFSVNSSFSSVLSRRTPSFKEILSKASTVRHRHAHGDMEREKERDIEGEGVPWLGWAGWLRVSL